MNVLRRMVQSVRLWAYFMCLVALLVVAVPKRAEATCNPCGGAMCYFNGSCYAEWSTWCYNNVPFECEFLGGPCPDVVQLSGQCTP